MRTTEEKATERVSARPRFSEDLRVREVSASLVIAVIWLVVMFDAFFGPDFVSASNGGTTTIPSAVLFVPFAWLATRAIASRAFPDRPKD